MRITATRTETVHNMNPATITLSIDIRASVALVVSMIITLSVAAAIMVTFVISMTTVVFSVTLRTYIASSTQCLVYRDGHCVHIMFSSMQF